MRKNFLYILLFIAVYPWNASAQSLDTVFHKLDKQFEATVLLNGLHHLYTVKYNGKTETVWQWDYGGYMGVKILDIMVVNNKFISINSTADDIGYSVYEFKDGKWTPMMGGVLRFLNQTDAKTTCKILAEDKIKLDIGDKTNYYKLDFVKKVVSFSDH